MISFLLFSLFCFFHQARFESWKSRLLETRGILIIVRFIIVRCNMGRGELEDGRRGGEK